MPPMRASFLPLFLPLSNRIKIVSKPTPVKHNPVTILPTTYAKPPNSTTTKMAGIAPRIKFSMLLEGLVTALA